MGRPSHYEKHVLTEYTDGDGAKVLVLAPKLYEIFCLLSQGFSNKEISEKSGNTIGTASGMIYNILGRAGGISRPRFVYLVLTKGLKAEKRELGQSRTRF